MFKILSLITLLCSSAFAYTTGSSTYVTEFPIFVNGDVQSIENSFKFINKLFADMDLMEDIVLLASFLLTLSTSLRYVKTMTLHPVSINAAYLTFGVLAFLGSLNVSVHIEDQRTKVDFLKYGVYGGLNYAKVDDIPFPIAAIVSTSSTITYILLEKVNDATVTIDTQDASYSAIGYARSFTDVQNIIKYARLSTDSDSADFETAFVEYVQTCLLDKAYYNNHTSIMQKIRNPEGDFIKYHNPSRYGIGSESASFTDSANNTYSTCQSVYNFLTSKYSVVATNLQNDLKNVITGDGNWLALSKVSNMKIDDTLISGTLASTQSYILNAALIKPLSRAVRNSSATSLSGQDLANDITFESSKAKMQMEGIGQYKWMAEMLPLGFHFFLSIIYASSAFVFLFALAMGYEKGIALISNFAQGLLTFEFIQVAMALANNTVNNFASAHAADQLVGLGDNLASLDNINYYLDYIATMTGIAGILGVSAVFIIPTIVFTGKVAVAAGAIGGLAGKYSGNDVQTARDTSSESLAKREAFDNVQKEAHALKKAGYDVPSDMSQGDFYNKFQSDLNATSKGLMAATMGSSILSDASIASGYGALSDIASARSIANNTSASDNISHGTLSGTKSASDIEMSGKFVAENGVEGIDSYAKGAQVQSLRDKYTTAGMGNSLTLDDAEKLGTSSASMQAEQDKSTYNARQKNKLLDSDSYATDLARDSMDNRFNKESAEFAGVGKAKMSDSDLAAVSDMSKGKFEEGIISAGVYSTKAMSNGELKDDYVEALKGSEASKIGSMIATTKAMGGADNQEAFATASSYVKAKEDVGAFQGKLQEVMSKDEAENFGKKAGEAFTRTLDNAANKLASLAETKSGTQTRSDIQSINAAGGDEGYRSLMATKAVGDIASLATTIDEAEGKGGYVEFMKKSAREKTGTAIETLNGKQIGELIDEDGKLTQKGIDSVRQAAVTSAAEGIQRSSDLNNQDKMDKTVAEVGKKAYMMTLNSPGGNIEKAEAKAKEVMNELSTMMNGIKFDKDGNITDGEFIAKTGDAMAKTLGEGAGRRYTEKMQGATIGGLTFDMKDGQVSGSIADGSKVDLANKVEAGNQTSPVITDPQFATLLEKNGGDFDKAYTQYQTQKLLHHNASWQNQLGMAVSGIMPGDTPEEKANNAMIAGAVVAGGVGLYVGEKASKMMMDPVKQAMSVKDLTEENGFYKNDEGGYTNKNGTKFNVGEDGGVYREGSPIKEYQDVKKGFVSRSIDGTVNLFDKLRPESSTSNSFNNSSSETKNSGTDNDNTKTNKTPDDHIANHHNSSLKDNNTIISQNNSKLNSDSKNKLSNAIKTATSSLENDFIDGKIDEKGFGDKLSELMSIDKKLSNGEKIYSMQLKNSGINAKDLGLELSNNFVDFEASDSKNAIIEGKKAELQVKRDVKISESLNNIEAADTPSKTPEINAVSANEKGRDTLKNAIEQRLEDTQKAFDNGEIKAGEKKHFETKLNNIKDRIDNGQDVHMKKLAEAGIDTSNIESNQNGTVNFNKEGEKVLSQENKSIDNPTTKESTSPVAKNLDFQLGSQEAQNRWIDSQIKMHDPEKEKGKAVIERLEGYKGTDLNSLSDIEKQKIGLNSNAAFRIGQIDEGMIPNLNNLPEDMRIETPHNVLNDAHTKGMGNKFVQAGLLLGSVLGIDSMASELTGSDSILSEFKKGNIGTGAIKTAEALDPLIAGVQTVKEQTTSAYQNINNGNVIAAAGDIASIPPKFVSNVVEAGYGFGESVGKGIDFAADYLTKNNSVMDNFTPSTANTQQAFQQEIANGLAQQLQSQMQSFAVGNSMSLASNANTMHLDSIGGQVNIGQNSAGMLRVNGMQTQLPYANFQSAMQNDSTRNSFASMVSGIDMNNGSSFEGQSIHTVDGMMDHMQQRFNTQEYYALGQRKDVNMIGSYAEESFEKMEELMESNDMFIDKIDDLKKSLEYN